MDTSLNVKKSDARRNGMMERSRGRHKEYWPDVPDGDLWIRQKSKGFITIPRTMPILMSIIDSLTKGKPAGMTYFTLWCRCPDYAAITIESPDVFAAETGFTGQRKVDQWKTRMKSLDKLGFIKTRKGPSGDFHDVLLVNPHLVIRNMKGISEGLWGQLFARGQGIGAIDVTDAPQKAPRLIVRKHTSPMAVASD